MSEWIIVEAANHNPHPIGSSATPFRTYDGGVDPNASGEARDNGVLLTYLSVLRPDWPTLNDVRYRAIRQETTVGNAVYPGRYDAPNWVVGYDIVEQDLAVSREYKIGQLDSARGGRVLNGYTLRNGSTLQLPLTDDFFQMMQSRLSWFEGAVSRLSVPPTSETLFTDLAGHAVEMNLLQLQGAVDNFGISFLTMNQIYVQAINDISNALTPAEVDAVTWQF